MAAPEAEKAQREVYVVDDDASLRHSLEFLLASKDIAVRSFSRAAEFLEALPRLRPAPVLLDIRMPGLSGIDLLEMLVKQGIRWPLIVLSGHGGVRLAVKAMNLGAMDFLEKPVKLVSLERCLERAFHALELEVASAKAIAADSERIACLTPRESQVLIALCAGQANKQVAFSLSISPRTVEMHRANAMRCLGVRTVAEVVPLLPLMRAE